MQLHFGNIHDHLVRYPGLSNETRGIWSGGYDGSSADNKIRYVTIASTGDTVDFGDSAGVNKLCKCWGQLHQLVVYFQWRINTRYNVIEYITISTLGNAADFGNTTATNPNGSIWHF